MKSFGWLSLVLGIGLMAIFLLFHGTRPEFAKEVPEENSHEGSNAPNPSIKSLAPVTIIENHDTHQNSAVEPVSNPTLISYVNEESSQKNRTPLPPLKDVLLRDEQGNYPLSGMDEAIKACEAHGMRLPTIRELAHLGQARGAKGILEGSEKRDQDEMEGYKLVRALTAEGKTDQFYYNPSGYVDSLRSQIGKNNLVGMPSADGELNNTYGTEDPLGRLIYWSHSETVGHHDEADPELRSFYVLDIYGKIHDHYRSVKGLARCVTNP